MTRDEAILDVLHRLEADNRMLKRVGAGVLALVAVLTCAAMAWQGAKKQEPAIHNLLRTRRLEIANANGGVVAILQAAEKKEELGWLTEYHDNGRRKWRAEIDDNRYDGTYTAWWSSGLKSEEGTYGQGRKHGLFTTYHKNGQPKSRGAYDRGKKVGIWISWHQNGGKASEGLYADDLQTGSWKQWHDNGKPVSVVTYKAGKPDGLVVRWYDNEQKAAEGKYVEGRPEGVHRAWYSHGQLRSEGSYDDAGKKTGEWKAWKSDGSLDTRRTATYENGRKVVR